MFVQFQFDLFSQWDAIRSKFFLVEECLPMPRTRDGSTQVSFKWKDKLRCRERNVEDLINTVDEVLTFAYELGAVGRWYCHRHIERLLRGHDGNYFLGVDDELVGAVFELPFPDDCPSLGSTMAWLSRHGVPVFGVQVIGSGVSLHQDFVPGGWSDDNGHKMAVQSASLPSMRSRDIIFKQLEFTPARPTPWIIKSTCGYPGSPEPSTPVELALADTLYPPHNPLYTEEELCQKIKSFFGHGFFPVVPPTLLSPQPSSPALDCGVVSTTWHDGVDSSDDEFCPPFEPPHQENDEDSSEYDERVDAAARKFSNDRRSVHAAGQLLQDVQGGDFHAIERCQEIWDRGHGRKKRQLSSHDYHIVSNWSKYRPDRQSATGPQKRLKLQSHHSDPIDVNANDSIASSPHVLASDIPITTSLHFSPPRSRSSPLPNHSSLGATGIQASHSLGVGIGATSPVDPPPPSTLTSAERPKISFQEYKMRREAQKSSFIPTTPSPSLSRPLPHTSLSHPKTGTVALPGHDAPVIPSPFSRPNVERWEASVLLSGGGHGATPQQPDSPPLPNPASPAQQGRTTPATSPMSHSLFPAVASSPSSSLNHQEASGSGFVNSVDTTMIEVDCIPRNVPGHRATPLSDYGRMTTPSQSASLPVVTLGHWYRLMVVGVQDTEPAWLEKCHAQGVYATHRSRKGGRHEPPSMEMLFKYMPDHDKMAEKLRSEGKFCSSDIYVGSLNNHYSMLDLPYIDVAFTRDHADIAALVNAAPLKANKTNHLHSFLQYEKYPPLVPCSPPQHPPPNQRDRTRPMESITFTATWLQSRVYQEPFDIELHRFEVLVSAHSLQPRGLSKFSVPMWPTSGPMDLVIRRIARWAREEMMRNGEMLSIIDSTAEKLQYHPRGSNWQIVLELDLDQPRYMKHVAEPWTHLI
jgi:hypothetical protein